MINDLPTIRVVKPHSGNKTAGLVSYKCKKCGQTYKEHDTDIEKIVGLWCDCGEFLKPIKPKVPWPDVKQNEEQLCQS